MDPEAGGVTPLHDQSPGRWPMALGLVLCAALLAGPAVADTPVERVTSHPALDYQGVPSADGRFLAFVSDRSGNADVWLASLSAGLFVPPRQLTTHPGKDAAPSLDANGSRLLYVSYRNDPRGDVFLLDVLSGQETRLTDGATGDGAPAWGAGNTIYYLSTDPLSGVTVLVRRVLPSTKGEAVVEGVRSFAVGPEDRLIYSDGRALFAVAPSAPAPPVRLTSGSHLDLWPAFVDAETIVFTRYQEDSNGDGILSTDDESSIYMGRWDPASGERRALYRVTPTGAFHLYPAAAGAHLYFTDLRRGNVYRLEREAFLDSYATLAGARERAAVLMDRGDVEAALLTLTNMSVNLVPQLPLPEQAEFDLALVGLLRDAGRYAAARQILARYAPAQGRIGRLQAIASAVIDLEERAPVLSPVQLEKAASRLVDRLERVASDEGEDRAVRGRALVEAGRLRLLADDPLAALPPLLRVDAVGDEDAQAGALFLRATVYRRLGQPEKVLPVFLQVIRRFGEDSFWGARAVAQAVSVAEEADELRASIASLTGLADRERDLPRLGASALLRAAELYDRQGEVNRAVALLDRVTDDFARLPALVAEALQKKGRILAAAQRYEAAAEAYAALVELTGRSQAELQRARRLMVLQRVRGALRTRDLGEVRIAAKELRRLIEAHQESVEAHRGYIETKVMLGEVAEVQDWYRELVAQAPDRAAYRYGLGLALSYSTPPDLDAVIGHIEDAVALEAPVSYFHQTLGWAYEQLERAGRKGALERAEREYRMALELNDAFLFPEVERNLLLNLGNTYLALGNHGEAYRHYARRVAVASGGGDGVRELLFWKRFGEAAFKTGRTEESIAHYRRALALVPEDKPELEAELLERIGLSYQEAGDHAAAVQHFSRALERNLARGATQNLARLRRNIGVNLYNLDLSGEASSRDALKQALASYFASLEALERFGAQQTATSQGLLQLEVALGADATGAAGGFDRRGEEKLMFSYIASTYERLSEPAAAREYYLKKLALIRADGSPTQAVAARTETAVVLNRLGVLSHALGERESAVAYLERSLAATRDLGLRYGTSVNLYNLSRLAVEQLLSQGAASERVVALVVEGSEQLLAEEPRRLTVYLLANAASLLAGSRWSADEPGGSVQEGVARAQGALRDRQRAVSFVRAALRMVEERDVLPPEEAAPARLLLRLNLLDQARAAGKQEAAARLRDEVDALLEERPLADAWLHPFLQADAEASPARRAALLEESVQTLLALPPQALPRPIGRGTEPFYDGLAALAAQVHLDEGRVERAFSVTEQIAMRRVAARLFDDLGPDFFVAGLGDYGADLAGLLRDMRAAVREGRGALLEELGAEFEELVFALYEEYPWAVSYLFAYEPASHLLTNALRPETPYLKILAGREGHEVFLHDGERVLHGRVTGPGQTSGPLARMAQALTRASAVYVAASPSQEGLVATLVPPGAAVIRVATVYDILNARATRSLFTSRVAWAGERAARADQMDGTGGDARDPRRVTVSELTGEADHDRGLIDGHHVLVATGPVEDYAIVVSRAQGVQEGVAIGALAGRHRHTAILLNPPDDPERLRQRVVPALIRAGFSHVLVARDVGDRGPDFVSAYLRQVQSRRPDRAAVEAAAAAGMGGTPIAVQLYGFVGMAEEERARFAAVAYDVAVADTIAAYQEERFAAALRRAEDALSIIGVTGARQDFRQLAEVAVDTAFRLGDYATAAYHQEQLLRDVERAGTLEERAGAWYRLGVLYSRMEQFEPAVRHLETAIGLWRDHEELDRLAEGIATLGVVKENMGAYSEALDAFGRSFELYRDLGESADMAAQHRRIGRIDYLRLGRYERARESFAAAREVYEELPDRRAEAETLLEIGLTFEKTGLFDEAEARYREGRALAEALGDHRLLATSALYLANTAWFRGQYQEAFEWLAKAERQAEQAEDSQLPIMIANTKALVYWTLNDLDKALVHGTRALAIAKREDINTEIASSHNNLGLLLREANRLEESLEHFEQAKSIDERLNSRWGLGYDHRNIGMSLMKMSRYDQARANLELAERYSAEIENVNNWVKALLELGNLEREVGNLEAASTRYQRTYEVSTKHRMKEVVWRAAAGQGAVLRARGRKAEAVTWYAKAVDVVEGMRAALKVEEFRNSFQTKSQDLYRDLISLLVELGRYEEGFNYLERSRARSFIDLLGNQKLELKTAGDQQAFDRVTGLQTRLEALGVELASFETPPAALQTRYRATKVAYEEALIALKQSDPQLSSFVAVDPLTQEAVERLLEPGVGLLSYKLAEGQVLIWLVTSEGTTFARSAGTEEEIHGLVRAYRERVQRLEPVSEELRRLHALLIGPVERQLTGLAYVGIIPDGPLHFLSFAALQGPEGALVERVPLFYAPSASVLKYTFAKRSDTKRTRVLAMGNPDLGSYNYELPLAELEARSIRWEFPTLDILTGEKATKEWITANISRYGIIHLATHGEFDEVNPLLSSLWLASPDPDNRRLTVREVFSLDIRADLVTLSACQTGLGKLEGGELIGLNRAFMYAGTHALVSALWRVDDLATSVLMKHFYRNYVTMDKATSLRRAQLLVKRDLPHPAYWAGLALVGDYQ